MAETTGYNSKAQAAEILSELSDSLDAMGVAHITRARIWQLPSRPCVVLVGPSIEVMPLSLGQDEAVYNWLILVARDIDDNDRRADTLDDWADVVMAVISDLSRTATTFQMQAGDGPRRLEDHALAGLLERTPEKMDATAIAFNTRVFIQPPCSE